jgi:magnesium transporter
MNIDPALASAAFVTGFTDTFGFLFFLGLATLFVYFGSKPVSAPRF